jgi:cytochrome b
VSATSASPADGAAPTTIQVWDLPTRVFHILLVVCFAGAYLTAESETWRLVHVSLGYTMAGLVGFRLAWGLWGTRHARFASFVRGPRAVLRYLHSLVRRQPEHHTGHNPAGAVAILALLGLTALLAASGWITYNDLAGEWVAEGHEAVANAMLALVGLHVAAVVVSSWLHRENLARAMLTGRKRGAVQEGIRRTWPSLAIALLAAVLAFWAWQWRHAPKPSDTALMHGSVRAAAATPPTGQRTI